MGPIGLWLWRTDIGVINNNPLFIRAIGFLFEIRVFDIGVGPLVWTAEPPRGNLPGIGSVRLKKDN